MPGPDIEARLTPRERQVLALMAKNLTNAEIASELDITFYTAKAHVSDIIGRLGVSTREEAVAEWRAEQRHARRWRRAPAWTMSLAVRAATGTAAAAIVAAVAVGTWLWLSPDGDPDRLVVPRSELKDGAPHVYEVNRLGTNWAGQDISVWVVKLDESEYRAFAGRDPHSGCLLNWLPQYEISGGFRLAFPDEAADTIGPYPGPGPTGLVQRPMVTVPASVGAFKALCSGWVFNGDGDKVFGASPRSLDRLMVTLTADTVIVALDEVILGRCSDWSGLPDCSTSGSPVQVDRLPTPMIPDWGALGDRTATATATP